MTDEELVEAVTLAIMQHVGESSAYCEKVARAALSAIREAGYAVVQREITDETYLHLLMSNDPNVAWERVIAAHEGEKE